MSRHPVLTIRLVGGHPSLDLLNTVDPDRVGEERDVLHAFGDDVAWAVRVGAVSAAEGDRLLDLVKRSGRGADQAHADLLAAREALRAVVHAEVTGTRVDPHAAADFARRVAAASASRHFRVSDAPFGWRWSADDIDAVQHRLIFAAADLLADTHRRRISVCAGPDCDWYFLDTSKAGNRRWCSDAGCGTASRVRRLRRRRADDI